MVGIVISLLHRAGLRRHDRASRADPDAVEPRRLHGARRGVRPSVGIVRPRQPASGRRTPDGPPPRAPSAGSSTAPTGSPAARARCRSRTAWSSTCSTPSIAVRHRRADRPPARLLHRAHRPGPSVRHRLHRLDARAADAGPAVLPADGLRLLPVLRHGPIVGATIAFVILAIPSMLAGAYSGLESVDRQTIDAARANGMTEWQILTQVEIPLGAAAHRRRDPGGRAAGDRHRHHRVVRRPRRAGPHHHQRHRAQRLRPDPGRRPPGHHPRPRWSTALFALIQRAHGHPRARRHSPATARRTLRRPARPLARENARDER